MTLAYWVAECQNDSDCYNIRETSKKAVIDVMKSRGMELKGEPGTLPDGTDSQYWADSEGSWNNRYSVPHKVTVEYDSGLDLLKQCLSEGRIFEGKEQ